MTKKSQSRLMRQAAQKAAGTVDTNDPLYKLAKAELDKIAATERAEKRVKREQEQEEQRLIDEAMKKPDTCWDDLNNMYANCQRVFAGYGFMARAMNDKRLLSFVANKASFIDLVNLLKKDLETLKGELNAIHAMHVGRTGGKAKGRQGDLELIAALEVNEHYQIWIVKHDQLIERTSAQIRAMIQDAEAAMLRADQAAAEAAKAAEQADAPVETATAEA